MKIKKFTAILAGVLSISLFSGLWMPYCAKASSACWYEDEKYSLTIRNDGKTIGGIGKTYTEDNVILTHWNVVKPRMYGSLKFLIPSYVDGEAIAEDDPLHEKYRSFLDGNPVPMTKDLPTGWKNGSAGKGFFSTSITFEEDELKWNFNQVSATPLKYIKLDSGARIPVCFLGWQGTVDWKKDPIPTEETIATLNLSLNKLKQLVKTIDEQSNTELQVYYPEHKELLKRVARELYLVLQKPGISDNTISIDDIEYSDELAFRLLTYDVNKYPSLDGAGFYTDSFYKGAVNVLDEYVEYVQTHKIAVPAITSFKLGSTNAKIDNEKNTITITGKAEDYAALQLTNAVVEFPDGVKGSWNENAASFADKNLTYTVYPYNENLNTTDQDKYKSSLGKTYTVVFDSTEETYKPVIKVSPEGLNNAEIECTERNISENQVEYTVTAASPYSEVTNSKGQHYAFSHWELDEQNRDIDSTKLYSGGVSKKVHMNTERYQSFVMPAQPLTLTAVYEPAYQITMETTGLSGDVSFDLHVTGQTLSAWCPKGDKIQLYYYDNEIPSGYLVDEIQVKTADGTVVESEQYAQASINYIEFSMPSDNVTVTAIFEKDPDSVRKLIIGEQSGDLIAGKGGTATYELTAEGYSTAASFTVVESYNTGIAKDPKTEGLTVLLDKVTAGKGTITVTVAPEVAADKYYFCVTPSEGKLLPVGTITVLSADTKMLEAEDASITLKENESGEMKIKGSSMNLSAGASVEAFETDQDGQIKYSGKTEGLTFDKAVLNNDAFTLVAHVSKTVAKGEYYFIVKADNEQSTVAKLTVDREKAETPDQPEKETQKITVTSNASQGSIQIKVAGGSEELISGTGTVKAVEGDTVTVTAVPKDGYKLSAWKITQGMKDVSLSSGTLSDSSVSFVMPAVSGSDTVTVGATFDKTSTEPVETSEPKITAFSVANVSGTIDQESGTITVVVPNGTDVTSLCPAIAMSGADSVTPANGAAVNFTNSVTYTVKNASGVQKSYVVTVKVQEASVSDTLWDKITSPEGDRSWWKKADSIKSHKKNKYPKYW
ncbi:hypothetical protein KFE18_10215 [Clostridiaceae bacterium Marseille-Q4143]|nr:hypothetical protein KFE18_10215 [Clostridiaceae bacterium Marseille-Q4143]